jgi:predicted enzyme related to lactoylglutathione lyase
VRWAADMAATGTEPKSTPADTAGYIGMMAKEMRALAAKADLGFLAYLLAMVADDAEETARRLGRKGGA